MTISYKSIRAAALAATVSTMAFTSSAPALAQESGLEIGVLRCEVEGGIGLILGSSKDIICEFDPATNDFAKETYKGTVNKLGLDIGITDKSFIRWIAVVAANNRYEAGALAGTYRGATASAAFIVGLGANVLVGGNQDAVALQPVSVQGQTGLNVAVGLQSITLELVE